MTSRSAEGLEETTFIHQINHRTPVSVIVFSVPCCDFHYHHHQQTTTITTIMTIMTIMTITTTIDVIAVSHPSSSSVLNAFVFPHI